MASTTVIAVASHALALLGLALTRPPQPLDPVSVHAPDLVPVTLEATHEPGPVRANASPEPSPTARVEPHVRARAPHRERARSRDPQPIEEPAAPAGAGGELAAASTQDLGSDPISSPAPPASAPADALPPPLVPRPIRAPAAVFGARIDARDGVSPSSGGAQILGAVRAVADKGAPRNGHGTIRVEVDATGAVTRVTSSSPSWGKVARSIQAALAGRRIRVPSGGRGLAITVAVDADVTNVPPLITGEAKAAPCSRVETDQVGRLGRLPDPGCVDWLALLPLTRHRVSVKLVGEQAL
jgi:hypothetical protein